MLTWKQFTEYAAEFRLKEEYIAQTKPFFEKVDPDFFDRMYSAEKIESEEIKKAFPGD